MHEGKKTVSGVARELMTTELTVRRWKKNYEKKLAKLESIAQSEHNWYKNSFIYILQKS